MISSIFKALKLSYWNCIGLMHLPWRRGSPHTCKAQLDNIRADIWGPLGIPSLVNVVLSPQGGPECLYLDKFMMCHRWPPHFVSLLTSLYITVVCFF